MTFEQDQNARAAGSNPAAWHNNIDPISLGTNMVIRMFGNNNPDSMRDTRNKVMGLGMDVAFDPLNFVGIGGLTKTGRTAELATNGQKIQEGSELSKRLAKLKPEVRQLADSKAGQAELGAACACAVWRYPAD
ncbi:MAG: hypothetical protein FH756_01775 [Firmicutes bacterium]|nr:hypothetical protein [Bacillota bacterium]